MRRSAWLAFLPVLVAGVSAGCGSRPVPAQPAYDVDVRPILMSHCVRCHGAGGMQNVPLEPTGPNAPVLPSVQPVADILRNLHDYFDQFDTTGDCTLDSNGQYPADCKFGAGSLAQTIYTVVRPGVAPPLQMPPAPAPPLDDWAIQILGNWATEMPTPVCSNSPNPETAICPNGP